MSKSEKRFDYLVFIGRFSPFHIGHKEVIETAMTMSKNVIVMVGSANKPRSIKNPWTAKERISMIFDALDLREEDRDRIICTSLRDRTYNDQMWVADVQENVEAITKTGSIKKPKIGIIGHAKDASSFYLKLFPQWELVEHEMNEVVNATDIRTLFFERKNLKYLQGLLPVPVFKQLESFSATPTFEQLVREYEHIKKYKKSWEAAPYPPIFVTVDAVVVQSGHVLLIRRKAEPGAGLVALCGGFLNNNERIIDGMIRELREETKIKVPAPVLKGCIKTARVFDAVDRSLRGRTITHAYLIELPPGELPQVKGSDDAKEAMWVPIADIDEEQMFEDHYAIIQSMLGRI